MKLLTVIFCLMVSVSASAQSNDTTRKDTSQGFRIIDAREPTRNPQQPLVIVDDKIYKRRLKSIDPNSIINIVILKDKDALYKYRPKGENGVIIITTKKYKNIDTVTDVKSLDSVADKDAMYVVDGVLSKNKLNGIDPQNIISIIILKRAACDSCYGYRADHGAVLIVTKAGAIKSYQKKFSAFSKAYKSYFDDPQNNDSDFIYAINSRQIDVKTNEGIKKLYDIPVKRIKKVSFLDGRKYPGVIKEVVAITTK